MSGQIEGTLPATTIHPTAIVDDGARLGAGCRVWHWVHISGGARIGRGCSFGQNVFVGNDVLITGGVQIGDLTVNQVVFTDGSKYLQTKTALDARTALQTTTYTHVQGTSANPWIITHNLNAYPTVWVMDPLGRAGWAEIEYVDNNIVKVHLPGPQTGTAYLNF